MWPLWKKRGGHFLDIPHNHQLQQFSLSSGALELFEMILKEENTSEQRTKYLHERTRLTSQIAEQQAIISKARKLLVAGILLLDDFSEMKMEYTNMFTTLTREMETIEVKLKSIENQFRQDRKSLSEIFTYFQEMDTADKRQIINRVQPKILNIENKTVLLLPDKMISKILRIKSDGYLPNAKNYGNGETYF